MCSVDLAPPYFFGLLLLGFQEQILWIVLKAKEKIYANRLYSKLHLVVSASLVKFIIFDSSRIRYSTS